MDNFTRVLSFPNGAGLLSLPEIIQSVVSRPGRRRGPPDGSLNYSTLNQSDQASQRASVHLCTSGSEIEADAF